MMSMEESDFSERVYDDGRTKQSFKDECDINTVLRRMQRGDLPSHLQRFGAQYADFSDFDYNEAVAQVANAKTIFEALPAEIRREFNNRPDAFFAYANDPENVGRLGELLPPLLEPGRQFPVPPRAGGPPPRAPGAPEAHGAPGGRDNSSPLEGESGNATQRSDGGEKA